jgi:hypothetical protein
MIGIHVCHRRLAELQIKANRLGGYHYLSLSEQQEMHHCLLVNAKLVRELDELKQLSFIAYLANDTEWQYEICRRIEELEAKML